uniref:Cyclin-like F-box; FBD n=1 Tax=Medicago truncatula TaxID=3880 RepID=Q2HRF2_MEDTR|nr:Cyclin-like F-box; FBD [Medicago truncatula]
MTLSDQEDQIDRISDLPCNVIDGILSHLDIKDLVGTSILSKQWRYKWTKAPRLWFSEDFFEEYEDLEDLEDPVTYRIITDVLMQHQGPIDKFGLFISNDYKFEITIEHLDKWIPILSERNIKHLELVNHETHPDQMLYIVDLPCKELTYSKFLGFDLSIPPDFSGFERLLELHLLFVRFEPGAFESLISGCPLLKNLHFVLCKEFEYFDFAPPTLEVLLIEFNPKMKSICLKKANNLIDLALKATESCTFGLIKSLPKNIQRLSISSRRGIYKYANIIHPTLLKSSFSSMKYLKLGNVNFNDRGELLYIVSALQCAPGLVELIIQSYIDLSTVQVLDHSEELECSSDCLNNLRMVNIHVRAYRISQHAMSLIRFILANSTSLRTLTFIVCPGSKSLDAHRISQDLLRMERASQRAHVEFLLTDELENVGI